MNPEPDLPNILRRAVAALESPGANDDYKAEKLGKAWDGLTLALRGLGVHAGDLHDGIDRAMQTHPALRAMPAWDGVSEGDPRVDARPFATVREALEAIAFYEPQQDETAEAMRQIARAAIEEAS